MHPQRLADLLDVGDRGFGRFTGTCSADLTGVGDLATGLGVQRGAVGTISTRSGTMSSGTRGRWATHGDPLAVDEDTENFACERVRRIR